MRIDHNPHGITDPALLKKWQEQAKIVYETKRNQWFALIMWTLAVLTILAAQLTH